MSRFFGPRSLLSFIVSALVLFDGAAAPPPPNFPNLQRCVGNALMGPNARSRMQTPLDATYDDARIGAMIKPVFPAVIAFVTDIAEVAPLIACASQSGFQAVPRSGRHHFEGWSALNGSLVIDVSHINYVDVSEDLTTATIGAGANLGHIYTTLSVYGKTFLGGICPSVALGGYIGTGGYNLQQRQLGLAVDQILSFKLLTASGELLTVAPTQHPELWWAARGGGTFGIVVETTVKILTLPRSAMVKIQFPDKATRYEVTKAYQDWSPRQVPEFTSQLNLYSSRASFIGWYLGGTVEQLKNIMDESGLLDVPNANISISGDCSTENSRMFWLSDENSCIPDDEAYENFLQSYNTPPIDLEPIEPAFRFDDVPALPSAPAAQFWPRFGVISKTYFQQKSQPVSDAALQEFIDRSGALDDEVGFWGEFTSFNISAPPTTGSFPWQEEASILGRIEVATGENPEQYSQNREWMASFDTFYRAQTGNATYLGYTDAGINVNPFTAYYGSSICRLVEAKKQYDPTNFFRNPFSVPTTIPEGVSC